LQQCMNSWVICFRLPRHYMSEYSLSRILKLKHRLLLKIRVRLRSYLARNLLLKLFFQKKYNLIDGKI